MGVVSFKLLLLYLQGNSSWYPLERRLGEPQNRCGRLEEEKKLLVLSGIELRFFGVPAYRQVAIPTDLYHNIVQNIRNYLFIIYLFGL
jgi:hypothetical protein